MAKPTYFKRMSSHQKLERIVDALWGPTGAVSTTALLFGGGTAADPITSTLAKNFVDFRTSNSVAASTGDTRGIYWRHTLTNASGSGETARFYTVNNGATATAVHGAHITAALGAAGNIAGLIAGVRATLGAAAATKNMGGTGCCLQIDTDIGAGNTLTGRYSMIRLAKSGSVDVTTFLDISDDQCLKGSAATGSAGDALKVLLPDGSTKYISLIAAS
jgi:hypothetical protein